MSWVPYRWVTRGPEKTWSCYNKVASPTLSHSLSDTTTHSPSLSHTLSLPPSLSLSLSLSRKPQPRTLDPAATRRATPPRATSPPRATPILMSVRGFVLQQGSESHPQLPATTMISPNLQPQPRILTNQQDQPACLPTRVLHDRPGRQRVVTKQRQKRNSPPCPGRGAPAVQSPTVFLSPDPRDAGPLTIMSCDKEKAET